VKDRSKYNGITKQVLH